MTLKSCDFLVNTSRRHESEDKNARHTGSASVLHNTEKYSYVMAGVSFRMRTSCYAQYDKNTHDLCPRELKQYTRYIPHEMNVPIINLGGSEVVKD